jgi:hypothetical protein
LEIPYYLPLNIENRDILIVATKNSVHFFENKRGTYKPDQVYDRIKVRRVYEGDTLYVVASNDGSIIILDENEKKQFETGIKDRIDSLCLIKEKPLDLLIGTTPPHIYRINEAGSAVRIKTFDDLDVRDHWYTPWGGPAAVRSMASTRDGWIYADIHVGSIMRSPDNGRTWEPVTPTLHKDVHEVTTTPSSNSRVYANTYLSVYISDDNGESWEHRSKNLNNRYGRGVAVNPGNPDIILCGVSDGPRGTNVHGQLYYTEDAGGNWTHVYHGFPESTKKNIDTFHIVYEDEDVAWVSDEDTLFQSKDRGQTWESFWKAPEEILMISCRK